MAKVDKRNFQQGSFRIGASKAKQWIWYVVNVLLFTSSLFPFYGVKKLVLRIFGAKIGKRFMIKPNVNIKYPWKLKVGDYVGIGEGVWIDNLDHVTISDHSTISQGAMLLTGNHDYTSTSWDLITKPIVLEEGTWVGAKSVVCPGVVMKSHSILTVGSVLLHSTEPYMIYSGNPAKPTKERVIVSKNG